MGQMCFLEDIYLPPIIIRLLHHDNGALAYLEIMNKTGTFSLQSLTVNEFQCDNQVLISGHYLLHDVTSCLAMSLPTHSRHHESYSAHYLQSA